MSTYAAVRDGTDRAASRHRRAVAEVADQILKLHALDVPFRVFHGSTNSTRPSERTRNKSVDISGLDHVLSVSENTCVVEPNVPMDKLVAATLSAGLVPPVVPEFPGITVGGAYSGTAGESSSWRYGFFDTTINWVEVVLADGEVVAASKTDNEDLLGGMAGTFGTLGVATLFEIRLIPAKPFVRLTYHPVRGVGHARQVMTQAVQTDTDFVDGIMFTPNSGVVMTGRMVDRTTTEGVVTFGRPWDEWFYLHAEKRQTPRSESGSTTSPPSDLTPLVDYLFRYDRGAFWTGRYVYPYFLVPFTRLGRRLLDPFMHTRVMYHALHRSGLMQRFVIQDMAVPPENLEGFSRWLDSELPDIYPRWLCPLKTDRNGMNPHFRDDGQKGETPLLINVGVWGPTPVGRLQVEVNRRIESSLKDFGGMKWLYAQTFYTEAEFWAIYDRAWYERLRAKYRAGRLPSVYDKVRTKFDDDTVVDPTTGDLRDVRLGIEKGVWSVWPLAGVYGVLSTLKGGDYLRKS
jgi:hypothetical protein